VADADADGSFRKVRCLEVGISSGGGGGDGVSSCSISSLAAILAIIKIASVIQCQ